MKREHLVLLAIVGYVLYSRNKPTPFVGPPFVGPVDPNPVVGSSGGTGGSGAGGVTWISCDDPNADQTLCHEMGVQVTY
jgi:hypothetical protein